MAVPPPKQPLPTRLPRADKPKPYSKLPAFFIGAIINMKVGPMPNLSGKHLRGKYIPDCTKINVLSRTLGSSADTPDCYTLPMKAVVITRQGGPEVLEVRDVPEPAPGPGEELVRVEAGGINFADTMTAPEDTRARRNLRW